MQLFDGQGVYIESCLAGFGFVAGSEKPVVIRSVIPGKKLQHVVNIPYSHLSYNMSFCRRRGFAFNFVIRFFKKNPHFGKNAYMYLF